MLKLSITEMDQHQEAVCDWTEVTSGPFREDYPEIEGRSLVRVREFWKRGNDRMIIEWEGYRTVRAVALNGHWFEDNLTIDQLHKMVRG